jgi:hypothetical protein
VHCRLCCEILRAPSTEAARPRVRAGFDCMHARTRHMARPEAGAQEEEAAASPHRRACGATQCLFSVPGEPLLRCRGCISRIGVLSQLLSDAGTAAPGVALQSLPTGGRQLNETIRRQLLANRLAATHQFMHDPSPIQHDPPITCPTDTRRSPSFGHGPPDQHLNWVPMLCCNSTPASPSTHIILYIGSLVRSYCKPPAPPPLSIRLTTGGSFPPACRTRTQQGSAWRRGGLGWAT